MDRRDFLKSLGLIAAAPVVAKALVEAPPAPVPPMPAEVPKPRMTAVYGSFIGSSRSILCATASSGAQSSWDTLPYDEYRRGQRT